MLDRTVVPLTGNCTCWLFDVGRLVHLDIERAQNAESTLLIAYCV